MSGKQSPKEGSREWLEQLPRDERWVHTEVLAMYGDQVVNPSYEVAIYHLRYAVAEVKRLVGKVAKLEACADCGHVEAAHSKDGETDCNASGARLCKCTCVYFIPGGES
jgi:hypothetical protein